MTFSTGLLYKYNKMKNYIVIFFLMFSNVIFAQENKLQNSVEWNAYAQLRAYSNFNDNSGMMLRRFKLWAKSKPDFSEHWSYKVQTTITSLQQEKFFFQDAKIAYKTGPFSFDFGQFVPEYSLQRFQSDYKLPIIERAVVVNSLIPNGTLGVRDIGIQANYTTKNKMFKTHVGIFNGYGIKEYRFNNQGYMLTNKSEINIPISESKLKLGYSILYRRADNLLIPKVFSDTVSFTGNDFRYNLFVLFSSQYFEIQAESLNVDLGGQYASGWYVLSSINIKNSQIVFSYEQYNDLISTSNNNPYFHLGCNYLINKNKIKLFFDNTFQFKNNKIKNEIASIQLQLFFN